MKKLSQKQILMFHKQLIQQTGGSDGVRDYNLLDAALEAPFQCFDGQELYEIILSIASGDQECDDLLHWVLDHQK